MEHTGYHEDHRKELEKDTGMLSDCKTIEEVLAWMKANENHDGWLCDYQTIAALHHAARLAFAKGAEAAREQAAKVCDQEAERTAEYDAGKNWKAGSAHAALECKSLIRALPLPEMGESL